MRRKSHWIILIAALMFLNGFRLPMVEAKQEAQRGETTIKCHMRFDMKAWSIFYKSGKGRGTITCNNGQRAAVKIRTHGGGLTFGKTRIENGKATFTKVHNISDLYGGYAASEAHVGASRSAAAQAMTKGDISMSLTGTGHGVDIGIAFGKFKITPVASAKKD